MVHTSGPSSISLKISSLLVSLWFLFLAGCAGVTIKDNLPPSSPKGYADFAKYGRGYDVVYSMKGGKKVKEGSLGYTGATLRIARTPGSYDFLIEQEDSSSKKTSHNITLKIERDMLTFVTSDDRILDVEEGIFDRRPTTTIKFTPILSVAKTPAPLQFQPETAQDTLRMLFDDPDWRARLYAVTSLEKMKSLRDQELIKRVTSMASDDPQRLVRLKCAEFLKGLGVDPYENVLFLENFEANNKRRWLSSSGRYDDFYNDEFVIKSAPDRCETEIMTSPLDLPKSFDVELVSTWKSGAENDAYGFYIGSDKDNFDQFGISGDGRAIVRSTRNNEVSPDLIAWTAVDGIIKRGTNRLKVEVRGNTWKYSVNGTQVGTVENKLELPPYALGLTVCQKQTISFDQLKITYVPEK
jgi:hypothetical protein